MILFSQSPSDVQYVLSLYDKYKNSHKIKIIVVNIKNNYYYYKKLDLNVNLEFIPTVSQKNILEYIFFCIKLRSIYRKSFSKILEEKIYFFSSNYDYVTAFFIEKLYAKNEVTFINIYKQRLYEKKNALNYIKKKMMNFCLGIDVYFDRYSYIYVLKKQIKQIYMSVDVNSIEAYKYKIRTKSKDKKSVLFFESNGQENNRFSNYEKNLDSIMTFLLNRYDVYIKPHPRLGYSNYLEKYDITIIDTYIPSELLVLNKFDILLGIESSAIVTSVFHTKYCLINLFEYNEITEKIYMIEYLKNLSNNYVVFLDNLNEIKIKFSRNEV